MCLEAPGPPLWLCAWPTGYCCNSFHGGKIKVSLSGTLCKLVNYFAFNLLNNLFVFCFSMPVTVQHGVSCPGACISLSHTHWFQLGLWHFNCALWLFYNVSEVNLIKCKRKMFSFGHNFIYSLRQQSCENSSELLWMIFKLWCVRWSWCPHRRVEKSKRSNYPGARSCT